MEGWIRLHRKIWESDIWEDGEEKEPFDKRSAWIDLLMMANFKERKLIVNSKVITVKRGQTFTSIRKLSKRWHWGAKRTMAYLKVLEDLKMVTAEATPKGTLLTLVNYEFYQGEGNTNDNAGDNAGDNKKNKYKRNIKKNNKVSTFSNISQRESSEEDIYSFLERRSK